MKLNIVIIGGTGLCREVIPILEKQTAFSVNILGVFDDVIEKSPIDGVPLYKIHMLFEKPEKLFDNASIDGFVVCIGNPHSKKRIEIGRRLDDLLCSPISIIHKNTYIDHMVDIKVPKQLMVFANASIRENVKVGDYCILCCSSLVSHDCTIKDGVEIGPGAVLCGNIVVEANSWVGANATVLPNLTIGNNSVVGAGSVVTHNVPDNHVVCGNPARFLRLNGDVHEH